MTLISRQRRGDTLLPDPIPSTGTSLANDFPVDEIPIYRRHRIYGFSYDQTDLSIHPWSGPRPQYAALKDLISSGTGAVVAVGIDLDEG